MRAKEPIDLLSMKLQTNYPMELERVLSVSVGVLELVA